MVILFDGSFWEGILEDNSGIPNITAEGNNINVKIRSLWSRPEIDVRMNSESDGECLLVLNYSDGDYINGEYVHTGDFKVSEVRSDGRHYRDNISEIYRIIEMIESVEGL